MASLYVSDLDGTLFGLQPEISEFTRETLNHLIEDGLNFTVATARNIHSIQEHLQGLNLNLPVISLNGACLSDLKTGEHLVVRDIPDDVHNQVLDMFASHQQEGICSGLHNNEAYTHLRKIQNQGMQGFVDVRKRYRNPKQRVRKVRSIRPRAGYQVINIWAVNTRDRIEALADKVITELGDAITMHTCPETYEPEWHWLIIGGRNANKRDTLAELATRLDVSQQDVTVFGDNLNDLEMFEYAGTAVAVANAVEPVKRAADCIIGTNDEDAVAHYLKQQTVY